MNDALCAHWRERIEEACEIQCVPHANSLIQYVLDGVPVGGFLTAVLANDLMEAAGRADMTNSRLLKEWAIVLYNAVPTDCKGSYDKVDKWIAQGGLRGLHSEVSPC